MYYRRREIHGRFYTVENAVCLPKPVQKPLIPIWLGGASRSILEGEIRRRMDTVRPDTITPGLAIRLIVGKSSGRIEEVMRKLRIPADKQTGLNREELTKYGVDLARGTSDFDLITFVGTPREITYRLRKYSDA